MPSDADQIDALVRQYGIRAEALHDLMTELGRQGGASHYYVFWNTPSGGGGGSPSGKARTIICFRSPDAALSFAQRNRLGDGKPARLRRIGIVQLLAAMLGSATIAQIRLADEPDEQADDPLPGQFPPGQVLTRADVLQRLGVAV